MRTFKLVICLLLVFTFCLCILTFPSFANNFSYIWEDVTETSANITNDTINNTNVNAINNTTTNNISEKNNSEVADDNFLSLDCGSAILIEQSTGQVLYAYNIHEQLHPASVTKVMSILLIMEALDSGKINLTDEVPCSENAASMGGSQIWLDPRETLTVDEMLKAICVNSANDRSCCNGRVYSWY